MESYISIVKSLAEINKKDFQDLDVDNVESLFASSSKGRETPIQCRMGKKAPVMLVEVSFDSEDANFKINSKVDYSCSGDSFSSGRSYTDECGWLPWPLEQANGMDGSQDKEDECGWLPWPLEQANDMDGSQAKEDECGWLPWPVEKDK